MRDRRLWRVHRGVTAMASLAVVAAGVALPAVVAPATAVESASGACEWKPDVLPLPDGMFHARVTAGAGEWLAGIAGADGPNEAVRWRDGEVEPLGAAFGLHTAVTGVNVDGVVVGTVTGTDRELHAFRHRDGRFERLPESAGSSVALDVNARGDVVGHDGSRLVLWPATGPPRFLDVPPGEAPYGRAVVADDGAVVARTGYVAAGALRWRGYTWTPDGERLPLPAGDVQDVAHGQVVGARGELYGDSTAAGWGVDHDERVFLGGTTAVAVNDDGLVVGAGVNDEPLLWDGVLPTSLPTPLRHTTGAVTALNEREAGGFAFPLTGDGAVPLRWQCR
jgi:probable HAF family extracellular repeat protein